MVASATDYFQKVGRGTATTLGGAGFTAGGTSMTVGSTTNWASDTGVTFAVDVVDSAGERVSGTYNVFRGTVATGTSITDIVYVGGDAARNYPAGATTRVYVLVSAYRDNRMVDGLLVSLNQTGTLKNNAVTTAVITDSNVTTAKLANGAVTNAKLDSDLAAGWVGITGSISAVTYNGNRSYSLTTSSDNSGAISPGMRLRTTRTVSAPTQSASLNGTNNYFSKTSPAGMTFTDDFVVSAWVKLTAYSSAYQQIVSRYNGTQGWNLQITPSGQVALQGMNASASNYSYVQSYQSIPVGKWVHITAQLDMSSFTATTTTSYVMLDGVDVPCTVARGGTNPTALVQAGNLEIGGWNGGLLPFNGKIAQVAIYNAKVTQATIRGYISQGLSGSETSLISAYSFNNSITDLNTTNANNLTNNNSTSITNADSPFGGQADGTISATKDYAIVQTVSASTLVVQVPEGGTIPTTGGVSACSYSSFKNPYGFPGQVAKWTVEMTNKTSTSQSSASEAVWYNLGSQQINIPIGEWNVGTKVSAQNNSTAGDRALLVTLSTGSSTETDKRFTMYAETNGSTTAFTLQSNCKDSLSLSAATVYYLNTSALAVSTTSIYNRGDYSPTKIFAENAYV